MFPLAHFLRQELRDAPGRASYTLRLTLSCAVLITLFMTLQIPFLAVALIVVFYVSQPNVLMIKLVSVVFFVTVTVALGGVLLICGLLTAILFLLLNGGGLGLLIGGCLALAGLMMLLPPVGRLVTLWILWSCIVLVFMPRAMGVKPKWIFSADLYRLCGEYPYFWYLIMAWAEVLTGLSLTAATVRMVRRRKK